MAGSIGPIPPGVLRLGSKGKLVQDLQQELTDAGYDPGGVDGVFGPATAAAVQAFESANQLAADGVVGPKVWAALGGDRFDGAPPLSPESASGDTDPNEVFGGDFSHYQSTAEFDAATQNAQWAAVKATEGSNNTDASFQERWLLLGTRIQQGTLSLRVAYEFLRPGDGTLQAKHLLETLGVTGPLEAGTRLALDWEGDAVSDPTLLKDAATYIQHVTGLWPLVYCTGGDVTQARAVVPDAPIWEAKWSGGDPTDVLVVQYNDGPNYDHDVFNGDLKALRTFAGWGETPAAAGAARP